MLAKLSPRHRASPLSFAIIRRNGLGDLLSATIPLCHYINETFPLATIHLFCSEQNFPLVDYCTANIQTHIIANGNKYWQTLKTAIVSRYIEPDIGISPFPCYPKLNNLFLLLIGARERMAPKTKDFYTRLFVTHPRDIGINQHCALKTIQVLNPAVKRVDPRWFPRIKQNRIIDNPFSALLPNSCLKILVEVSNHRKTSYLNLPTQANLLNQLHQKRPIFPLISFLEKDKKEALQLQSLLMMPSLLASAKNIHEFISNVNLTDLFLLGDGGTSHIAGALGKAGVVLVGGMDTAIQFSVLSEKVIHLADASDVNNIPKETIYQALEKTLALLHC